MAKPQRRVNVRSFKDYQIYKSYLREDFNYRCGYCDIHENDWGYYWHFHVDHHRPKSWPEFKHLETVYSNLLYACDQCNNMKLASWPSDDPITDGVGWLDPCEYDLAEHFYYQLSGDDVELICLTRVGEWMAKSLAMDQVIRKLFRRKSLEVAAREQRELQMLRTCLEVLTEKDESTPTTENTRKLTEIRQLLQQLEESISRRYEPLPFASLRRTVR
jgi:hypothetical protein